MPVTSAVWTDNFVVMCTDSTSDQEEGAVIDAHFGKWISQDQYPTNVWLVLCNNISYLAVTCICREFCQHIEGKFLAWYIVRDAE